MIIRFIYWLTTFVFSLSIALGALGFGVDYYHAYHRPNWSYGSFQDHLGFYLVGQHWGEQLSLGVFFISMMQFYIYHRLIEKLNQNSIYFYLVAIIIGFGWAHLISSLNMLRQGLSISLFILFVLNVNFKSLYITLHFFTHKMALVSSTFAVAMIFLRKINISFSMILFRIIFVSIVYVFAPKASSLIIGKDLTTFLIIITIGYELSILFFKKFFPDSIVLLLQVANTIIWVFIIMGAVNYAERIFISFFPIYFFSLGLVIRTNLLGVSFIYLIAFLYVIVSWTLGPLNDALYFGQKM
ncbi:hypothetical protein N9E67_00805 [Amylibacter sp.]|nr:hypothetical protein [Amylibacter sp.]MDC3304291.1 hypothetical protein [Amylibacter sp.]